MHSGINSLLIRAILLLLIFTLVPCSPTLAGTVVIKPGQFDHFTLQSPERAVAGENFVIKVSVYDANNNLITNFSETSKEFKVDVSGSATSQPAVLSASAFSGGIANVLVNNKKAEKTTFSIRESGGTVPVISRDITVVPNKLDHFTLQSPASVTAGNAFEVKIAARDMFDNMVSDVDVGKNIKITSTGTSAVKVLGRGSLDFRGGLATAVFSAEKTGDVVIELQDITSGSRGKTQAVQVTPAALALFKLQAPKAAVAGEPFELLITAYDVYNNLLTNYSSTGSGVKLTSTGSSMIEPAAVNSSEFKNGQSAVKVTYEKAEEIQIVAREANREQSGKTAEIQIANAAPDHFVVITPDTAVSGRKFKVKVEAYDRFNNLTKDFNLVGNDVVLSASGSGTLSPSKIFPPDFTNGVAIVEVMYDKAESFQINARMASDKSPGRISISEREEKMEVAHVPPAPAETRDARKIQEPEPKAVEIHGKKEERKQEKIERPQPKPEPKKEAKPQPKKEKKTEVAKKETPKKAEPKKEEIKKETVKEAEPQPKKEKKTDVVKKETPKKAEPKKEEIKKETVKEAEPQPKKEEKKEVAKKETQKKEVGEPEKKSVEEKQVTPKKEVTEAKPIEKKPLAEETKKPGVELAKIEEKKPDRPLLYNLSNVSIIEAKNKAMLVINISNPNGTLDYGDEIESKYGKEWLKLRMTPAVSSTEKLFKFKSAYVGEVRIEDDKTGGRNTVNVYIELVPSGLTYDIARIKNTLVITLSNP
jgi:hypothetical protein